MNLSSLLIILLIYQIQGLQWFFNPFSDDTDDVLNSHIRAFELKTIFPRGKSERLVESDENHSLSERSPKELAPSDQRSEDSSRSKFARQLSFNFRPFESFARNLNFQSPSNTFCMFNNVD